MHNLRAWTEWSDIEPQDHMGGCIEAECVVDGKIHVASARQYHYCDEKGSLWGYSEGSHRAGDYKLLTPRFHRWRFVGPLVPGLESQGKAIVVWSFYDAPGELRCLSRHGGDEDWVALMPKGMDQPSWMESGTCFGCCDVSEHQLDDGRTVYIGAHA